MAAPRNLVNLSAVGKDYAARTILDDVTLGVAANDRIGVVGANGQGKSTLLALIGGHETPDRGQVTQLGGLRVGVLDQGQTLDPARTVGKVLLGGRAPHELTADRELRGVLVGLLGGVGLEALAAGPETEVRALSGGERRRTALARVLLDRPDLLLLDEPTNHLDVEAITWLAAHLAARRGALMVVTHDRWFLDAVCTHTWEVADRGVNQYEGGYAAYVLAKAERESQAAAREQRRLGLVRKELAWLRRGPPARTAKPRFRIEAANALIADEPPARDSTELLRFASTRLGKQVLELEHVSYSYGGTPVIRDLTWRLGPGDRVALVGVNGSGKSTLLALMSGELQPDAGQLTHGQTVTLAHLTQHPALIAPERSVLEAVEEIRRRVTLAGGQELTAGRLLERFGFRGEKARTRVAELSGGELRRLTLMRLLMGEPNVLLLDEPTNDLDIETLRALEDLLDSWPGTLVVVSHDRYFVERVSDNVFTLDARGAVRHLPGGIDQYLAELRAPAGAAPATARARGRSGPAAGPAGPAAREATRAPGPPRALKPGAALRSARKQVGRLEREIERHSARERELHELMAAHALDHVRLGELSAELQEVVGEREALESQWLDTAALLEG